MLTSRLSLVSLATLVLGFLICASPDNLLRSAAAAERPNVVLIMTDDQGYGDFGATGNALLETPNIDRLARDAGMMSTFYVSPVCAPTRACLMTGRYNYRTRVIDTWLGRAMMEPNEVTIAEQLSKAGYATGIFGKWHLGDCYPMRAMDQGFEESLLHRGGGLAQPSDPRQNARRYTDPILFHNGEQKQAKGYCTDIYFDAAQNFLEKVHDAGRNFFVYIPTNAPHGPYHDVPEELRKHYQTKSLGDLIVGERRPAQRKAEIDRLERIAAMITNIDLNVGKLMKKLEKLGIVDNTIVLMLTDNGPNTRRFVGPLRGMKSEVHEGGIRTPLWIHWPSTVSAGSVWDMPAAHIDIAPTILDACGVKPAADVNFDGVSFLPLLKGAKVERVNRYLAIQSHRGNRPVRYHHFMIRDGRWKLLHASGFGRERFQGPPKFELYDLQNDPGEQRNLLEQEPEQLARLKKAYDRWFDDVSSTAPDNYAPPKIYVGSPHENPTALTRQDWRGGSWQRDAIGHWEIRVAKPGDYRVTLLFEANQEPGRAKLQVAGVDEEAPIAGGATSCKFDVQLKQGDTQLHAELTQTGLPARGVYQVIVRKRDPQ